MLQKDDWHSEPLESVTRKWKGETMNDSIKKTRDERQDTT